MLPPPSDWELPEDGIGSLLPHFRTQFLACGTQRCSVPGTWKTWKVGGMLRAPQFIARDAGRGEISHLPAGSQSQELDPLQREFHFPFPSTQGWNGHGFYSQDVTV